eukprot:93644-Rhodomonas_salina.2
MEARTRMRRSRRGAMSTQIRGRRGRRGWTQSARASECVCARASASDLACVRAPAKERARKERSKQHATAPCRRSHGDDDDDHHQSSSS